MKLVCAVWCVPSPHLRCEWDDVWFLTEIHLFPNTSHFHCRCESNIANAYYFQMGVTREAPTSLFVLLLLFVRLLIQWESLESNVNGNVCGDLHSTHAVQCLVTGCLFPVVACCVCCTFPLIAPQELIRILFAKPHAADFIYLGSRQWHKIHHKRTSYISALNSDISSITEPWLKIQPAVDVRRSKGQRFLMLQSI